NCSHLTRTNRWKTMARQRHSLKYKETMTRNHLSFWLERISRTISSAPSMGRHLFLKQVLAAALVLFSFPHAFGQAAFHPDKMDTVLYGAAYYPEYMPYERLDKDIELMNQAGITVVRMGESSWGLWEPEDGRFEYAWMDRVVEAMHKAGIKVIMGTPT